MMLSRGGRMLGVGIAVGVIGSYAAAAIVQHALPTLRALGQLGIGLALGLVGLGACYFRFRCAARVNPVEVLRAE